ncbi:hypothetical protein ACEPPN_018852 [Leptodophora sp. 'Broadleaf-Isolate-01']
MACRGGPRLNDRFPIDKGLSPPILGKPIPECSEAAHVEGFVPCAIIRIYSNITDQLAEERPPFGFADIILRRPLNRGESIAATQEVQGITSEHSIQPVIVSPLPTSEVRNTKPDVGDILYECGRVVPTSNLIPGTRVHVEEDAVEIGNDPVAATSHSVVTSRLHTGGKVRAWQVACEETTHSVTGPRSDPVTVKSAPSPIPPPFIDPNRQFLGSNVVELSGLLVGAGVEIFQDGSRIMQGWLANSDRNTFPVERPLSSSPVTATQELCGNQSHPSDPATPSGKLLAPKVLEPICKGSQFAVVRDTIVNAIVVVMRNGTPIGYGGAAPGDVIISFGSGQQVGPGDVVTAVQYMGPIASPISNSVTVVQKLHAPAVEILGGEAFFLPKGSDVPIDGPVFPRGRGPGPLIKIQACCRENVGILIIDSSGRTVAKPPLTEVFPGYWTASWPWESSDHWKVPDEIPVGRYTAVAHSSCSEKDAVVSFYVIFNPDDVKGPPRFSFDDTTIWFGAGNNKVTGLHYYLRQSDTRVFSKAINAVNGETNSYAAAIATARMEEGLFTYSLNYHTNDVLDMILNYSEAQCADDSSVLTSFLRAVGIPAHNVTADAGLETGAANWTFDTWVEFLAPDGGVVDWRIFHPHEYPGMVPETRSTFGTTRPVAVKSFNDIIVMANESWVSAELDDGSADASFTRNSCNEPEQTITKAFWIDELCERRYWPVPHWDCPAVIQRSIRADGGIELASDDLAFSSPVVGSLSVKNDASNLTRAVVTIALAGNLPESKTFPNSTFSSLRTEITLQGGESAKIPFSLNLPPTCPPGQQLLLWAGIDNTTLAIRELQVQPLIQRSFDTSSSSFVLGKTVSLEAVLTNTADAALSDIDVSLTVPWALVIASPMTRRLEKLDPGHSTMIMWSVKAVAELRSRSVNVVVSTANGGGVMLSRAVSVRGAQTSGPQAIPGVWIGDSDALRGVVIVGSGWEIGSSL